jgi:GMP synthase-like glutamine amidotransferase
VVLIIEHVEGEGAGLLTAPLGEIEVCRAWREPVAEAPRHEALIVMGGPHSAWDDEVQPQVRLIQAFVAAGRPVLGVCLGAQLLARALGGRNFRGPAPEKGVLPISLTDAGHQDPLLGHLDGVEVVEYHSDSFDLPPGATLLASSQADVNQAFRLGNAWACSSTSRPIRRCGATGTCRAATTPASPLPRRSRDY